jgi:ribosomal protein S18 acetylase RimI-like enzyme
MAYQLRPAEKSDQSQLQLFINTQSYLHRHLDWRETLQWLGHQPFYLLEENRKIIGVLACPPEPPDVAWMRMFGVMPNHSPDKVFQILFEQSIQTLSTFQPRPTLVSLAMRDWFESLLRRFHFQFHQDIVVFLYDQDPPLPVQLDQAIAIRPMETSDLPAVTELDQTAFEPIWRLSPDDVINAYQRSSYSTVAEIDGKIIAYQMSSASGFYAHLARLAVHPGLQRRRIGYAVVQNLLEHFIDRRRCWGVTLNTQHDNASSIALYHRIGFRETGERFPVYIYPY